MAPARRLAAGQDETACELSAARRPAGGGTARRALCRFGVVGFVCVGDAIALGDGAARAVETAHVSGAAFRFILRGAKIELCVVGAAGDTAGALLHRARGATAWSELSLPPLEFQLLRALCDRATAEAAVPARVRGCVATRWLVKELPFQSRFANEENVRQVVRRLRASLTAIGGDGLIEVAPGRGYYLTWSFADPG